MSIINEALRKAQKEHNKESAQTPDTQIQDSVRVKLSKDGSAKDESLSSLAANFLNKPVQTKPAEQPTGEVAGDRPSYKQKYQLRPKQAQVRLEAINKSPGSLKPILFAMIFLGFGGVLLAFLLKLPLTTESAVEVSKIDEVIKPIAGLSQDADNLSDRDQVDKVVEEPKPARIIEVTLPPPVAAPVAQDLELTGIVHGDGDPMAIINGSVYMVGESINGNKITEISDNSVMLETNGQISQLIVR
ncbi:hypothetical protein ACFL0T_01110 [Candidatus Omnitrophota bacterium]